MKKINFIEINKKQLDEVLEKAKDGTIDADYFDSVFPLVQNDDEVIQFNTVKEVSEFLNKHGVSEAEYYKYIFTCVDGDSGDLILLNGWRMCNRLFYVVSTKSWSTGNKEADGNLYIEAMY